METIIYLTRHGQTEWNIEKRLQGTGNSPLTKAGIKRAEELGERIRQLPIHTIYTSPLGRALETASIISGERHIPIQQEDRLKEMCFGDYEGKRTEEITQVNSAWDVNLILQGDTTICAPNGETLEAVRTRVKEVVEEIIAENKGKTILIVTHGITLKALLYYFKDSDANTQVIGQATLTKIVVDEASNTQIVYKNDDSHFTTKEDQLGW